MKTAHKKYQAIMRLLRLKKRKKNQIRQVCLSMLDFEYSPLVNINELTGELVRNNTHTGIKLYQNQ